MGWRMIGKPQVVKATHAVAEKFRDMDPAPRDRELNENRCAGIKQQIVEGQFRTAELASASCAATGKVYRVNGKHTSTVLAEMNGEMPKDLWVVVEEYECDTLEDVARLYCTFDTRKAARTTNDINRIYSAANADLESIPSKIISKCVTGMAQAKWGEGYSSHSTPEERAALLLTNGAFVCWFWGLISQRQSEAEHIKRGPCIAAMFLSWQKSHRDATEFWEAVRDGSGKNHKSPDRILNKFLLSHSVANGRGKQSGKRSCGLREMTVRCLHAWNAWRTGTGTDLKYYPNSDIPLAK